jgi:hypothetical protein
MGSALPALVPELVPEHAESVAMAAETATVEAIEVKKRME